jgi:cysteine desulfurase
VLVTRHYLDHASTSPARPEVVEAMLPWLSGEQAADPGRVHTEGRMARVAIEDAREKVAAMLGARPREVVFTSGATEAINAAVFGADGPVVCAAVEHSAVRDASARGQVHEWPVDEFGRIQPGDIPPDTALVHCQWGNHEVGTLQPVTEVVARCREAGVLIHVDAAAAVGHVPIAFDDLAADLMSVSAHKFGGPKGAGALLVRRGLRIDPMLVGGEQERARRAGMENVPAIVGFGAAAETVDVQHEAELSRAQTARALKGALEVEGVVAYGDTEDRLPHLVCLGVEGVEAEAVLLGLDQAGIAAHSGSSCSSESLEPSPVLQAMGVDADRSLRVSAGWSTTDADIDAFLAAFPDVVARLRALRT